MLKTACLMLMLTSFSACCAISPTPDPCAGLSAIVLADPYVKGASETPPAGWVGDFLTLSTARQIAAHNITVESCED